KMESLLQDKVLPYVDQHYFLPLYGQMTHFNTQGNALGYVPTAGNQGRIGALRDPLEPAALGSAIIYGPRPGPYGATFGRLGAARAARAVGSATDLAEALGDLLAPDRAALAAQAAWTVASDGAEVTEKVLQRLRQLLGLS
ncbi:MAG: hypothetical protein ACO22Z_10070, partial [Paracoccaceae bacterium]